MNDFDNKNFFVVQQLVNKTEFEKEQHNGDRFRPYFKNPNIEGVEINYE